MARRKVIPAEVIQDPQVMAALKAAYDTQVEEATGLLHNRITLYISEANVPVSLLLMVLEMVKVEIVETCMKHYFGDHKEKG